MKSPDIHALLAGPPETAAAWLRHVLSDGARLPDGFNWHGFAEVAAQHAHAALRAGDATAARTWASVAVSTYDRLAVEGEAGFSFECSAMQLRAVLIDALGEVEGDPVLDWPRVLRWLTEGAGMSFEEAEAAAQALRQIPFEHWGEQIERVRELRRIKNRIGIFRCLRRPPTPEINRWLALWSLLP